MMPTKTLRTCLLGLLITLPAALLSGCGDNTNNNTYNNTNSVASTSLTKAQVQGVLRDAVTNMPLANAVIDVGFGTATTNGDGQFTLVNVPAIADPGSPTTAINYTGDYTATINMTGTNALIKAKFNADKAANPNTADPYYYPDYDYRKIKVLFPAKSTFSNSSSASTSIELTTTYDLQIGKLSTTVNGVVYYDSRIVSKGLQPAAGATVKLFTRTDTTNTGAGNSRRLVDTTTTDANGLFTFSKVQSNSNIEFEAITADGKYAGTLTGSATPKTDGGIVSINQIGADGTVIAKKGISVSAIDTQVPVITSVSPEEGLDIAPTSRDIIFTFSKPIAADAYADGISASTTAGLYKDIQVMYNGAKAGNVPHSLAWNTARTALTVTIPVLGASSKYSVDLTTALGKLKDVNGLGLTDNVPSLAKVNFTTFGGATAAAPTVIVANSATLDFNSNPVLDWLPTSGAKYYAVYRSLVQDWGTTKIDHPYQLLGTTYDTTYTDTAAADVAAGANYPAAQNKKFVENGAIKLTYNYQIKAVNSDNMEGTASVAVAAADAVGTNLTNSAAFIGDISDGTTTVTLSFTEPLNKQAAQTVSNYTLAGITSAPAIASAVYNGWDNVTGRSSVTLNLSGTLNPANITRTNISSGTDGNCNTPAVAGDTQIVAVGTLTTTNPICVSAATFAGAVPNSAASDFTLQSIPAGDDVIVRSIMVTVSTAVTDVAGNAIKTTTTSTTTAGNRINSDGTFTLP